MRERHSRRSWQDDDHCWITFQGEAWKIFAIRDCDTFYVARGWQPNVETRVIDWPSEHWAAYARKAHARLAQYMNEACDERECDGCGRLYRGPAVYCSLACALADA